MKPIIIVILMTPLIAFGSSTAHRIFLEKYAKIQLFYSRAKSSLKTGANSEDFRKQLIQYEGLRVELYDIVNDKQNDLDQTFRKADLNLLRNVERNMDKDVYARMKIEGACMEFGNKPKVECLKKALRDHQFGYFESLVTPNISPKDARDLVNLSLDSRSFASARQVLEQTAETNGLTSTELKEIMIRSCETGQYSMLHEEYFSSYNPTHNVNIRDLDEISVKCTRHHAGAGFSVGALRTTVERINRSQALPAEVAR